MLDVREVLGGVAAQHRDGLGSSGRGGNKIEKISKKQVPTPRPWIRNLPLLAPAISGWRFRSGGLLLRRRPGARPD